MRVRSVAIGLVSMVAATSFGQQQPGGQPQPAGIAPIVPVEPAAQPPVPPGDLRRAPVIRGDDGQPVAGVHLASADVQVQIRGPLAEATMILSFKNDTARPSGGELTFPLPEGATVAGYGLDINGVMVDGVAVEKQQARVIYEKEIRKGVDPGMVEQVAGNNFRTRLFPIPANGSRSIKITYVADLAAARGGKGASFTLPLGFTGGLDAFKIAAFVEGATAAPVIHGGSYEKPFEAARGGFQLIDSPKTDKPLDELRILLPEVAGSSMSVQKKLKAAVSVEDLEEINKGGPGAKRFGNYEHYFVLTDSPEKPAEQPAGFKKTDRVLVVWDASLSRAKTDVAHELKLLEQSLAKLGHPAFDIALLRNEVEMKRDFEATPAGLARGIEFLQKVTYDGATNLSLLRTPKVPAGYGLVMLFSDGQGTLGADSATPELGAPVYAITEDATANHALLRNLAQTTGGAYLNLKRASDAVALETVGKSPFALINVEFDASKIADVSPGVGTSASERITLSGRLLAPEATVTLVYGYGKTETSRRTFTLRADTASEGSLLGRFWATQRSQVLALAGEQNKDELLRLGREFNLVTPYTSLLVLETPEQYVMHRVVPPKSRPEVYQAFIAQIEQHKAVEQQTKEQKVQQVLAMWETKTKWWEQEFKYPKDLKVAPAKAESPTIATAAGGAPSPVPTGGVPEGAGRADPHPMPARAGGSRAPEARPAASEPAGPVATPMPAPTPGAAPVAPHSPEPEQALRLFEQAPQQAQGANQPMQADPQAGEAGDRIDTAGADHRRRESARDQQGQPRGPGDSNGDWGYSNARGKMSIQTWDPNTPYLKAMKEVAPEKAYAVFLEQRPKFEKSPAFYFDCADYLLRVGQKEAGIRVLTDIVELKLEDARLIRIAAHRLAQIGETDLAIDLFERVLKLRPEEPQSYRDLALVLADRADKAAGNRTNVDTAKVASDYGRSLDLLNKVVTGRWDRFQEIEIIALMEANRISARLQAVPNLGDVPNPIDSRLRKNLDCDVRIVLTWDADQTDIDLWVTEPSGEVCIYNHNRTTIGGAMSRDFTDGYGPEEYALRRVMPGEYKIQANFYGSRQAELTGPCTVQATVITNFGRPTEQRQQLTLRLGQTKEVFTIGTVKLGTPEGK